ncbi:hypothetical protein ACFL3T_03135 [Patescibacteria group bacterium]
MKLEKNIQKVALIFFLLIGFVHILAHLMILNDYAYDLALTAKKILEIPFILTAAVYGFISIKLSFTTSEKNHKISNLVFLVLIIILFAILVYLNLFIPDRF